MSEREGAKPQPTIAEWGKMTWRERIRATFVPLRLPWPLLLDGGDPHQPRLDIVPNIAKFDILNLVTPVTATQYLFIDRR